jgi:hypothetical protein
LPRSVTALGVSEGDELLPIECAFDKTIPAALDLQSRLIKAVGWPNCRKAYEENLRKAEDYRDYVAIGQTFEQGSQGTGDDLVTRRQELVEAEERVRYYEDAIANLDKDGRPILVDDEESGSRSDNR